MESNLEKIKNIVTTIIFIGFIGLIIFILSVLFILGIGTLIIIGTFVTLSILIICLFAIIKDFIKNKFKNKKTCSNNELLIVEAEIID